MLYKLAHIIAKLVFNLYFHLSVYGVKNVPDKESAIIASNHRSFLDIPIVGAAMPRRMFTLSKKEFIGKSRIAWLYRALGAISINRDSADLKGLKLAIDVLKRNNLLLLFPEGTRSLTGEVGDIKKGAIFLSYKAHVPVVPVGIAGAEKALHKKAKFPKPIYLVIVFGKPIKLWELFDPKDNSFYEKSTEYLRKEMKKCVELAEEKL